MKVCRATGQRVISRANADLDRWATALAEDFQNAGISKPYPEDSPLPFTPLSAAREEWWETEARKMIQAVAREFPDEVTGSVRRGPALMWRTLHHPAGRENYIPYPRVEALRSLSHKVIKDLRAESRIVGERSWLARWLSGEQAAEDLGLDERLRIDRSGELILGQEMYFRDLLHPLAVPGSYVWGDVMLYELKRAVEKVGGSQTV